jgi:succinate-semialdehyde dehydrogenase/glutarate-semialdehyde dehydrogenase
MATSLFRTTTTRVLRRSQFQSYTLPKIYSRKASTMQHDVPKLNDPSLFKTNVAYVNGEWVKAKSGKTFEVHGMLYSGNKVRMLC